MKSSFIALAAIAVIAVAAVAVVATGVLPEEDDGPGSAPGTIMATVWLDDGDVQDEYGYEGTGTSVSEVLSSALADRDLVLRTNGNVASVDGKGNSDGCAWTVFRWSSYYNDATGGAWAEYSSQNVFDGMVLAVSFAERTVSEDGRVSYARPDIEVKGKAYFFIRADLPLDDIISSGSNENAGYWFQRLPLSEEDLRAGVWIAGYGSTVNEALADATLRAFFPDSDVEVDTGLVDGKSAVTYTVDGKDGFFTYGTSPDMYGWFTSYLGWGDTKVSSEGGTHGTWTFWNMYSYSPEAKVLDDPEHWGFNQFALGIYDITKYNYFGLVLRTSVAEGVPGDLPAPSGIPDDLLRL